MIRKNCLERWAGFCPYCASTDKELVRSHEDEHTVHEYECNICGEHWEIEDINIAITVCPG